MKQTARKPAIASLLIDRVVTHWPAFRRVPHLQPLKPWILLTQKNPEGLVYDGQIFQTELFKVLKVVVKL